MNVGVIGAGTIGTGLVRRLVTTEFVSEVTWVNRRLERIEAEIIDLQQGLGFSPSCRRVIGRPQDARGTKALRHTDVVVITAGEGVPQGGTRRDVLASNAALVDGIVRRLLADYEGVVVVVTNPVDMMARTAALARGAPFERTLGLGNHRRDRALACEPRLARIAGPRGARGVGLCSRYTR